MASSILVRLLNQASLNDDTAAEPILTIHPDKKLLDDLLEWGSTAEDCASDEEDDELESRILYHRKLFFLLTGLRAKRGDPDVEQFLAYEF